MPDQTVSSGSTAKIINQTMANRAATEDSDVLRYIVDVTGDDVRIATADQRDMARAGFPIPSGTTFTIDPKGHEIVAHGDGSSDATVNVQEMVFEIGEVA